MLLKKTTITAAELERINYRSDDTVSFVNGGLIDPKSIESALDNIIYSTSDGNIWLKPAGLESSPINLSQVVLNEAQLSNIGKIPEIAETLASKVDKKSGYELSKNDFTDELVTKLKGIESGAQKNVLTPEQATTLLSLVDKVSNLDNTNNSECRIFPNNNWSLIEEGDVDNFINKDYPMVKLNDIVLVRNVNPDSMGISYFDGDGASQWINVGNLLQVIHINRSATTAKDRLRLRPITT